MNSNEELFDDHNDEAELFSIDDTNLDMTSLTVDSQPFLSTDDSCHLEGVVEKGQLEVNVRKVNLARSNSAVKAGMPCYLMTSNPRGLALIIEIDKYENDVQKPRIGSHVSFREKVICFVLK